MDKIKEEIDAWGRKLLTSRISSDFPQQIADEFSEIPDNELNDLGKVIKDLYPGKETELDLINIPDKNLNGFGKQEETFAQSIDQINKKYL